MTYSTCRIEKLDFGTPDVDSSKPESWHHFLPGPPGNSQYWLPIVERWAKRGGLDVEWIDSAWKRVPVTQAQLQAFLAEVFGSGEDSRVAALLQVIDEEPAEGIAYAIVAEEF